MCEQWRSIPGFDDRYEASDRGRVRNRRHGEDRVLKQSTSSRHGYRLVKVRVGLGNWRPIEVHTLVALAFYGPRPGGLEVRHLDGDQGNNHVENLRYGTKSENVADQVRHGTHAHARKNVCRNGHGYTPDNTYRDPSGNRVCRRCNRAAVARYKARKASRKEGAR